jgi:hypothetical protein
MGRPHASIIRMDPRRNIRDGFYQNDSSASRRYPALHGQQGCCRRSCDGVREDFGVRVQFNIIEVNTNMAAAI